MMALFRKNPLLIVRSAIPAIFVLIVTFSISIVSPAQVSVPVYPITINQTNSDLDKVFTAIENQSAVRFSYDKNVAQSIAVTNLTYNDRPLNEVLSDLQRFVRMELKVQGNNITVHVLGKTASPAPKTNIRISGKVIDSETGTPLAGVTVTVGNYNTISNDDGSFSLTVPEGNYIAVVSSMGYEEKKVTEIHLKDAPFYELNVTLRRKRNGLQAVVVTSSASKESIAAHYLRQKNAASITDGISAEQIARTPDNNMGQVLKRVTGVTTVNDRYIVVRGLTDRYNLGMIDGIAAPSTSMNFRDFSFDAIPEEVVSNVVVNKTATPELSSEFSGAQVSINTMDIPNTNFTTLSFGIGINDRSTGKDFYQLGRRSGSNFWGFDDNSRKLSTKILTWQFSQDGLPPGVVPNPANGDGMVFDGEKQLPYNAFDALAQSKKINNGGLRLYRYNTQPLQNYRIALGRAYALGKDVRFGFTGSISLRNTQTIVPFNNVRGQNNTGNFMDTTGPSPSATAILRGAGTSYRYNSTFGGLLNLGLQGPGFKIAFKNLFTSMFAQEYDERTSVDDYSNPGRFAYQQFQLPEITQIRQHVLQGEYQLPAKVNMEYSVSSTGIKQDIRDMRIMGSAYTTTYKDVDYYQTPLLYTLNEIGDINTYPQRFWTNVKETDYNWKLAFGRTLGKGHRVVSLLKLGYAGWYKSRSLNSTRLIMMTSAINTPLPLTYEGLFDQANMGTDVNQAYYYATYLNGVTYEGNLKNHAVYAMADQKLFNKLRLIYGIRAEYFNLDQNSDQYLHRRYPGEIPAWANQRGSNLTDKEWRALPSANIIYSFTPKMNVRAAYSKTAVRPNFRESSWFGMYDYTLNGTISGRYLVSTLIDNIDLRYEWYPSANEVISVTGFYKYMDKPIELIRDLGNVSGRYFTFINQHNAKNYGIEMEFRKSLGFIATNASWLHNIYLYGNATLIGSRVIQNKVRVLPIDGKDIFVYSPDSTTFTRPLYGQVPWIVNLGLMYQGNIWGLTLSYNRAGHRLYALESNPALDEYENGRSMLDAQIYIKLFKQKAEIKLNASNLFDQYRFYYQNLKAYEFNANVWKQVQSLAYSRSNGDRIVYRERNGRNFTVSFTYKF